MALCMISECLLLTRESTLRRPETSRGRGEVTKSLTTQLNFKLSGMMFLQYAIWGAWLPLLYPYLKNHMNFSDGDIGNMFAVGAVGAILAPFIAGQVADRFFRTERFLGLSHLLGALVVWRLASIEPGEGAVNSFLVYSLIYSLIYSPTLSLTNSLCFHHIPDRDRDFGKVRVWGTVGWIFAGILIGQHLLINYAGGDAENALSPEVYAGYADAFRLSALIGAAMGLYCFLLPKTSPQSKAEDNAALAAFDEVKRQPLLTLFLLAVPISCIHQFYFVHTAGFLGKVQEKLNAEEFASSINTIFGIGGGGLMTVGQISEILVLALIPFLAAKLSRKNLLLIGLIAYALRMAIFAYAPALLGAGAMPVIILGVALHGLCFGCFIFVAFMIVDEECRSDIRASAQSLFNLVIVGIGTIVGSKIATGVSNWANGDGVVAGEEWHAPFSRLFGVPMWASLVCILILLAMYHSGSRSNKTTELDTK